MSAPTTPGRRPERADGRTVARRVAVSALAVAGVVGISSCTVPSLTEVQLPGGAASGSDTYRVTAHFPDVFDLVPQAAVRVDDVAVGSVESIHLDTKTLQADVVLKVKKSVQLPDNALAELQQTSLLGEKYVALDQPETPSGQMLHDGSVIESQDTGRTPEVEEVFTALSDLVSGGGIGQLQNIAVELSATLKNREGDVRQTLQRLDTFVQTVDARKQQVISVLSSVDKLSATLVTERKTLTDAIDTISPAVAALAAQQADLTALLQKLSNLGAVATDVIQKSQADTIADLKALQPTLALAATLQPEVDRLTTDVSQTAKVLRRAVPGDYLQLFIHASVSTSDLTSVLQNPTGALPSLPPLPVQVPVSGSDALAKLAGVK